MSVMAFAFYLFALCTIAGGLFTVISRNPVHSVLWLILAFLSSAGLFVLLGAEFVAMLLIIVYVGAVARERRKQETLELGLLALIREWKQWSSTQSMVITI